MPNFCSEFVPVLIDDGEPKEKKPSERRLEGQLWGLAWDGYALAAAALEQPDGGVQASATTHTHGGWSPGKR